MGNLDLAEFTTIEETNRGGGTGVSGFLQELKGAFREGEVRRRMRDFEESSNQSMSQPSDANPVDHANTVDRYYDVCTGLMVMGWGESLHFAPLSPHETLEESKIRHQRLMISKLELQEDMYVADIGCGIGGPMRRVLQESGVRMVGININELQLARAKKLISEAGLDHKVDFQQCSFMNMDHIEDNTFDRGYAIESTCHAPDRFQAYKEIFRVLKPGALFWGQEMCMTEKFDPDNARHLSIKQDLMKGIALKDIVTFDEVRHALESAGFEVIEGMDRDQQEEPSTPWYQPMQNRQGTLDGFLRRMPWGRKAIFAGLRLAEIFRQFPRGSAEVVGFLDETAEAYVAGGENGIFTPLYCFLARKPQ